MAKFQSPLLGYNNNVRHKGRVFHIQTEDSGVNHPHIITHLFMDGGRILKSVKKSYAEHVGTDNMSETVRVMMKEQHKAMFIALRDGQFDPLVDGAKTGGSSQVKAAAKPKPAPAPPPAPAEERSVVMLPESTSDDSLTAVKAPAAAAAKETPPTVAAEAAAGAAAAAAAAAAAEREEEAPATVNEPPRLAVEASADSAPDVEADEDSPSQEPIVSVGAEESVDDLSESEAHLVAASPVQPLPEPTPNPPRAEVPPLPPPMPQPAPVGAAGSVRRPSAAELTLDFDALERDTNVGMNAIYRNSDLPPPPAALFAKHEGGTYRATERDTHADAVGARPRSEIPSKTRSEIPARPRTVPPSSRGGARPPLRSGESRYAPARPAAIFGATSKPAPSIFSDELLSDKSLDEVILSYLAEDLDPPRRK